MARFSSSHLSLHQDTAVIVNALQTLAQFFHVDVFESWWFDESRESASRTYSWRKPGIKASPPTFALSEVPWFASRIVAGEIVKVSDIARLHAEAAAEKAFAEAVGATATIWLPLKIGGAS